MSANTSSTSRDQIASFSGRGQTIGATIVKKPSSSESNTSSSDNCNSAGREAFLKRLESNSRVVVDNNISNTVQSSVTSFFKDKSDPLPSDSHSLSNGKRRRKSLDQTVTNKTASLNVEQSRHVTRGEGQSSRESAKESSHHVDAKKRKIGDETSTITSSGKSKSLNGDSHNSLKILPKNDVICISDDGVTAGGSSSHVIDYGNGDDANLVECPACPQKIPEHLLNDHLDKCLA